MCAAATWREAAPGKTCLAGCGPFGDIPAAGEQVAEQGTEIPVVPRAGTRLCSGAGPSEGKPGCIFSDDAEVAAIKPNPPMAAACATGARTQGTRRHACAPPWSHQCHPMVPSACAPQQPPPAPAREVYLLRPRRAISSALAAALACSSFSLARSSRIFSTWVGTSSDRDIFRTFFLGASLLVAGLIGQGNAFLAVPSSSGELALSG